MAVLFSNIYSQKSIIPKLHFCLLILYFSIPKIDIISVNQFGIRPLDFVSVIIFFIVLSSCRVNIKFVVLVLLVLFFEILIGFNFNGLLGVIYIFRFLQYMVIGISIAIVMTSAYQKSFLYTVIGIQVFISLMQVMEVLPNFDPARGMYFGSSFSGSFGTPAELSYFLVALIGLYSSIFFSTRLLMAYGIQFNAVIFAAAAFVLLGFRKIINLFSQRAMLLLSYLIILVLMLSVIETSLFIEMVFKPIEENTVLQKGGALPDNFVVPAGLDSLFMRINKFFGAFYYMRSNIMILLVGCGYGCGDGAIDSGLVRFLLEFGLLGFIFLLYGVKNIPKYPLAVFLVINFVFDGMWSSVTAPIILSFFFLPSFTSRNSYVHQK